MTPQDETEVVEDEVVNECSDTRWCLGEGIPEEGETFCSKCKKGQESMASQENGCSLNSSCSCVSCKERKRQEGGGSRSGYFIK